MRCRFVVDVDVNTATLPGAMHQHVQYRDVRVNGKSKPSPYLPAGTEYEVENADFFVRQGMAEPADGECAAVVGMTPKEIQALQHAYQRQAQGILPKDWRLFDAGVIAGYDEHGEYKPGPKWYEYQAELAEEDDEEDED